MALNPIGLAPLALVAAVVALVLYSTVDETFDRNVTRLARRLFGRYVGQSEGRERQLEAAYVGETYRGYASRTLLYAGAAAVAGAVAGAYAVGGFLLVLPDLVTLAQGLPPTMVTAFGIRDFELVLTPTQTLYVLIAGGIASGVLSALLTYLVRWEQPKNRADVRARNIDAGMARTIAFTYALSRGGMAFPDVLRVLARNQAIYGDAAKEVGVAVREMDLFGRDMISALRHMSRRTPSETFRTFSENLGSVLQSGQSLSSFLYEQYERHHEEAAERQADLLERLATVAEAYVTVFVAAVLFLMTILLVFGLTTTDTLWLLQLMAYLVIPLANVGFIVYLDLKLQSLGIADFGVTDVLDRHETTTFGKPTAAADRREVTDGGVAPADEANRLRLGFYDRVQSVRELLRSPVESLVWNPRYVLYITVPVAVLVLALRLPAALQASTVNVRIADDYVIQAALLILGPFALARWVYARRLARIEAATPDLLERLASLNEAGMTVVESLRRVRGSDLGVLTPEMDRIWADISMGANVDDALVRFGRRVRTASVTRVVTLLTNAMHASGELGPVFRIAATQARADLRLKRRRQQQMLTYLVVIYVAFLVFLIIIVAVQEVLVPSLPSSVPTPPSSNRLGVDASQFARFGRVDKAAYTLVFFHTALIQAVLTGFVGGQLGEGSLRDGAKHAAVLLGVAYVAFILLSSPVASMTVTGPAVSGDQITVESASLSEGGFLVVHRYEESGRVVGTSEYLSAGTHRDVRIQLDGPPPSGQPLVLVAHQDTNENERFDYVFGAPGSPDRPYAAASAGENVTVTHTVR